MGFLRDNIFTVVLGGGTIVLCLVLLVWGHVISGQIEDEKAERTGLAQKILSLSRGPKVNSNTIKSEEERVQNILKSLADVRKQNVEWNSRNFKVPDLRLLSGQTRAALPFDSTIWNRNDLAFHFRGQYHKQLDELLARLKPTTTPSVEEIDTETSKQDTRLQQLEWIQDKETGNVSETGGGPVPPVRGAPRGRQRANENVSSEARRMAENSLRLRKAGEGLIYAERACFSEKFSREGMLATIKPEEVWWAQVELWVQSDIVAVLGKTIQQVQENIPEKDRNVINSPIKRLVLIEIAGDSSDAVDGQRGKEAPGRGNMPLPRPGGPGRGMMMRPDMMAPPRGRGNRPPMGMMDMPRGRGGRDRASPKSTRRGSSLQQLDMPDTLTQNTANPVYDVVNYSFTVLMPTRFLPLLEKNLMEQNYHIILNEKISKVTENTAAQGQSNDLYYYGAEPICEVTIEAQLLLVADWTRGMWDAKDEKWLRLPLMPVEVMQSLSSSALRNEDKELISEKLPMPWKGSAAEAR